jgi:hypothetical protein
VQVFDIDDIVELHGVAPRSPSPAVFSTE